MSYANELTDRQRQILHLLSQGYYNKEIAIRLCISENTVEQHISHIYRKLNVCNRVEASRLYHNQQESNNGFPL